VSTVGGGLEAVVQCSSAQARISDLAEDRVKLHEGSVLHEADSPMDFGCSRRLLKYHTFESIFPKKRVSTQFTCIQMHT